MTKQQVEAELCRKSFFEFVKIFWSVIIREQPVYNWHIEYLCNELQKIARRVKERLPCEYDIIINIPPNSTKSTICSHMFPIWCWVIDPTIKLITGSYSMSLATRDAVLSRDIIRSEKFLELFPGIEIKEDTDNKTDYQNNYTGVRTATSVGGSIIGRHAHIIICLPYNQVITTERGEINIGLIVENKENLKVLSFDHKNKKLQYKKILKYEKNPAKQLIEIETKNGKKFICTEEHLVYTENKGYICAINLQEDDILITDKWDEC